MAALRPAQAGGIKLQKQDTQIEREDQEKINRFSRLNMKYHDMLEIVKKMKEEVENLTDARQAVEEAFGEDGALKLFLGEALISVDDDAAASYIDQVEDEKKQEISENQVELDNIASEMKELKTFLYAKFGKSINLEEDE